MFSSGQNLKKRKWLLTKFKTRAVIQKKGVELLTRVSCSNIEDLVGGLDMLGEHILESVVALIPIELLLVLLITVFPVFLLTVLSHNI